MLLSHAAPHAKLSQACGTSSLTHLLLLSWMSAGAPPVRPCILLGAIPLAVTPSEYSTLRGSASAT